MTDCPSSVKVKSNVWSLEAGTVLTCMSDGYPEPRYTWTDENGVVLSSEPIVTLTMSYSKLTCTATGNLTTPCSASRTIGMFLGQ